MSKKVLNVHNLNKILKGYECVLSELIKRGESFCNQNCVIYMIKYMHQGPIDIEALPTLFCLKRCAIPPVRPFTAFDF